MWPLDCAVAGSAGSAPARTPSRIAASLTVRHIGPAVSWVCDIGMMPDRETRPTVGLMPTSALVPEGHTMEPSVSVPTPMAARFAPTATPVPELEPQGFRSSAYALRHWPPRPLQPLTE